LIEYTHDVFISYSQADLAWVREELLPRLEGAGLKVLFADRDFEIGAPRLVNVERAVETSRHTLIVITPDWIADEWNVFETLLVSTTDPAVRRRKLIPVLLRPAELPSRLAMLTYADFTLPENRRWQWERLIVTLGAAVRDAPGVGMPGVGAHDLPGVGADGRAPVQAEDPIFVNRDRELDLLDVERLRGARSPYTLVGAPAGYGKTSLLRQVLRLTAASANVGSRWSLRYIEFRHPRDRDGEKDLVAAIVAALAGEIEPGEPDALLDRTCTYVVQELTAPLAEGRRAVLILLDGVERLDERARQWLYELLCRCYRRTRAGAQEIVVLRVVLAGRDVDRFWEGYALACPTPFLPQRILLGPLDAYAIQEWVWRQAQAAHVVLDDQAVRQIADHVGYLSGGHPGVIRGLMDDLAEQLFMIGPADQYYGDREEELLRACLTPVADELLRGVDGAFRDPVCALSVFRRVNANTVSALERAGALPAETDEVALLGELQRARVLEEPRIDEPFYRDRLLRPVLALDLAHRSLDSRTRFRDLNRMALDLYTGWVQDGDRALPASHLKATQRLYAVVEWLYHALHEERVDGDALRAELLSHVAALARDDDPHLVSALIADALDRDPEVRYLLRRRLGETGADMAREWLMSM
jgi:hypothetical protein